MSCTRPGSSGRLTGLVPFTSPILARKSVFLAFLLTSRSHFVRREGWAGNGVESKASELPPPGPLLVLVFDVLGRLPACSRPVLS